MVMKYLIHDKYSIFKLSDAEKSTELDQRNKSIEMIDNIIISV